MTNSPTPAERLALKTAHAALESRDASYDLVSTIVFALGSAGLLMDPETAEELRQLRASRPVDEDPIAFALTAQAEALHASSGAVIETPARSEDVKLRALLADQREAVELTARVAAAMAPGALEAAEPRIVAELLAEDPHDSPLHHTYAKGRDLPEPGVPS